ncbi:hypothetical protein Dimus_029853 [Dionaea muscipula]
MGGAGPSRAGLSYQHGETYVSQEQLVEFLATQTRLVSQVCRLVELQEDHETWLVTLLGRVDLISERQANKHRMLGFANTFALQLGIGESTTSLLFGLEDILYITGFPIDGKPVTGVDPSDVSNACLTFLGKSPEDLTLKKRNICLNWLKTNFEFVEDELDVESEHFFYHRAVFLGATILYALHQSMTNTLKKKSNEMVELFYSLMVFALERIPTLVEKLGCNDAQNYFGGTNFGRTSAAYLVMTMMHQCMNMVGHLKDVHAAIKFSEPALVVAVDSPQVGTIAGGLFDFLTSFRVFCKILLLDIFCN